MEWTLQNIGRTRALLWLFSSIIHHFIIQYSFPLGLQQGYPTPSIKKGNWMRASGKRWSAETEVRKRKYGIEKKVFSALLTHKCVLRPCRQRGAQSLRCESRVFGLISQVTPFTRRVWLARLVFGLGCGERRYRNVHVTARPKLRQTVSAWANHVGSMLLECLDSDADASVVVVILQLVSQARLSLSPRVRVWPARLFSNGSTWATNLYYSRDTSKYSPYLGTSPRQDYTHRVMLNDRVSARWSPMYQYLALASLRDSHPLPTKAHSWTDRWLFFSLPYFRFRTSVSVLRFPFQRFFKCPLNAGDKSACPIYVQPIN